MPNVQVRSSALRGLAIDLHAEFICYSDGDERTGSDDFDGDLALKRGPAALMAAKLGYKIFPCGGRFSWAGDLLNPPEPTNSFIRKWWNPDNNPMVFASLGASEVVVVRINTTNTRIGYATLARWEEIFGKLPRSRIVETPYGFDIHMRGITTADTDSLGPGLELRSHGSFVELPGTKGFKWLRAEGLEPAPDWVLDCRIKSGENEKESK